MRILIYVILISYLNAYTIPRIDSLREESCSNCHSKLMEKEYVHPVAEDACENCHEPNGNHHPQEGIIGFSLVEQVPDLCYICHDDVMEEAGMVRNLHAPMDSERSCSSCHSPHSSSEEKLLINNSIELCLDCHNRAMEIESGILTNMRQLLKQRSVIHGAIEMEGCVVCHKPHGSESPSLLNGRFPEKTYGPGEAKNYGICFNCHDRELLTEEKTIYSTNFRNGEQNLHFTHLSGELGRNCRLCHNLHAANNKHLIEDVLPYGNWTMRMNFNSVQSGGSCFPGCHGELSYRRDQ